MDRDNRAHLACGRSSSIICHLAHLDPPRQVALGLSSTSELVPVVHISRTTIGAALLSLVRLASLDRDATENQANQPPLCNANSSSYIRVGMFSVKTRPQPSGMPAHTVVPLSANRFRSLPQRTPGSMATDAVADALHVLGNVAAQRDGDARHVGSVPTEPLCVREKTAEAPLGERTSEAQDAVRVLESQHPGNVGQTDIQTPIQRANASQHLSPSPARPNMTSRRKEFWDTVIGNVSQDADPGLVTSASSSSSSLISNEPFAPQQQEPPTNYAASNDASTVASNGNNSSGQEDRSSNPEPLGVAKSKALADESAPHLPSCLKRVAGNRTLARGLGSGPERTSVRPGPELAPLFDKRALGVPSDPVLLPPLLLPTTQNPVRPLSAMGPAVAVASHDAVQTQDGRTPSWHTAASATFGRTSLGKVPAPSQLEKPERSISPTSTMGSFQFSPSVDSPLLEQARVSDVPQIPVVQSSRSEHAALPPPSGLVTLSSPSTFSIRSRAVAAKGVASASSHTSPAYASGPVPNPRGDRVVQEMRYMRTARPDHPTAVDRLTTGFMQLPRPPPMSPTAQGAITSGITSSRCPAASVAAPQSEPSRLEARLLRASAVGQHGELDRVDPRSRSWSLNMVHRNDSWTDQRKRPLRYSADPTHRARKRARPGFIANGSHSGSEDSRGRGSYNKSESHVRGAVSGESKRGSSISPDDSKPYQCRQCPARFDRDGHLKVHIEAVHEKKRPFPCQGCSASFGHTSSLHRHQRTFGHYPPAAKKRTTASALAATARSPSRVSALRTAAPRQPQKREDKPEDGHPVPGF